LPDKLVPSREKDKGKHMETDKEKNEEMGIEKARQD
jgi:hypothetical protein